MLTSMIFSRSASSGKRIVMLGPDMMASGGIASLANLYRTCGLFDRRSVIYVSTYTGLGTFSNLLCFVVAIFKLCGLLIRGKVLLGHVHMSRRGSYIRKAIILEMLRLARVPSLLHLHSGAFLDFYEQECDGIARWLVRRTFSSADVVVILSTSWKEWVGSIAGHSRIEVLYNPVQINPKTAELRTSLAPQMLFLGHLSVAKGVFDLLDAVVLLAREWPDLVLHLGGDGDLEAVKRRAEILGIASRVRLLGWVRDEAKEREFSEATCFVLPSYFEGVPMSLLEAMARALPVVSTTVGAIPEIVVSGESGMLVEAGDVPALASCIDTLLRDSRLAATIGAAGRKRVEEVFSADVMVPKLESLWANVLRGRS